jgi:hypothetical protein
MGRNDLAIAPIRVKIVFSMVLLVNFYDNIFCFFCLLKIIILRSLLREPGGKTIRRK